ncbi:MAG: DUF255 domain-containing protein [Prevotellaceae bacterium]|jgi:thiol:disulfide interchange protein DsbD|nr:DUF255 domain-containing protein [Prevotellaceae bacterium]
MTRKFTLLLFLLTLFFNANAQNLFLGESHETVKWIYEARKLNDSEFELTFDAEIMPGYYMYGMEQIEGPMPLKFEFAQGDYKPVGEISASKEVKEKFDEGFEVNVKYYEGHVVFKQKVELLSNNITVTGTVSYQACSSTQCIPGSSDFSFDLKGEKTAVSVVSAASEVSQIKNEEDKSLLMFFITALFMGLIGVITPCVFPMIPMTVSFFISGSDRKTTTVIKSIIFCLSVTMIYTFVGVIVAFTQNEAFATFLSVHWIPNLLFFILFAAFALSFFGMFEITLPTGLANRADRQADKGGYIASFFLAVTLAIVSFSCTGVFVGTLLVQSAQGGVALKPILGMFGFGLGLGLPFVVFAFMPALMKKLPKSGGWLNSVKVVSAFILAALSFKFLDIVDSYFKLNIITRDFVIAVWIAISVLTGAYLLGKIKLPHDSDLKHVGVFRLILAITSFAFAFYLLPGLFGAPLTSISALLPTQEKQVFDLTDSSLQNISQNKNEYAINSKNLCGTPKYSDFLTLPKGISGYFDIKEGLACAKQQNKPVLLDFKGHYCGKCKMMENSVFRDRRIIDLLNDRFIVIGLYTDDNTELPETEHVTASNGKVLKTIGAVNINYEATVYGLNAQPYFVITDADGKAISEGTGYETDADKFLQWLQKSVK